MELANYAMIGFRNTSIFSFLVGEVPKIGSTPNWTFEKNSAIYSYSVQPEENQRTQF